MSIYGELDPMPEHRTQFTFKGKREHIAEVNISNMAYPNHHIDIEIPHGSRDHVIVPETVKRAFNLDFELTNETRSIVNNLGRTLVKKKVLIFGSKQSDTISNTYICDTYKDLYLSEKELEEKLLQSIQSANGLNARVQAKKADGTGIILTNKEHAIKKTFDKRFATPLAFDVF